jgi:hypothetical protein
MAVPIQNLRSGTATKRPVASGLAFGQVAVNYNEADPAVYLRGDANALIKVSPVFVGSTAPNATPASGGSAGNSKGEQWLDNALATYAFKVWDGDSWEVPNYFPSGALFGGSVTVSGNVTAVVISGTTVVATTISGAVSGNASTATALQTARTINGVSFDGTQNITITAGVSLGVVLALA